MMLVSQSLIFSSLFLAAILFNLVLSVANAPDIFDLLIHLNTNTTSSDSDETLKQIAHEKEQVFFEALESIRGAMPDLRNEKGESLLHVACLKGYKEVIRRLVSDYGMNLTAYDKNENTPLIFAAFNSDVEIAGILIDSYSKQLDNTEGEGREAINDSIKRYLNHENRVGFTALHYSTLANHTSVSRYLLSQGADVNAAARNGKVPIQLACIKGNTELVELMVDVYHADVKVILELSGSSLLHMASSAGNLEVIALLIERYGLSVRQKDRQGFTPLHMACMGDGSRKDAALALIRRYGADVEAKDKDGETPLQLGICAARMKEVNDAVKDAKAEKKKRKKNAKMQGEKFSTEDLTSSSSASSELRR